MTGQQAIDSFKLKFDRFASFAARGYEDDEILEFLNNAQDSFIKERVFGKNFQPPAFEDNQKRVVDILPLVDRAEVSSGLINPDSDLGSRAYQINILNVASNRVLYILEVDVRINRTNPTVVSQFYGCEEIKTEYSQKFLSNNTNRPWFLEPKFFQTHNTIHVLCDYYTTSLDYARLSFVKRPYPITATSQEFDGTYSSTHMSLDSFVHDEFIEMAVKEAFKAASDDNRFAASLKEEQIERK